jgi:multiple antibiotic resistance protein
LLIPFLIRSFLTLFVVIDPIGLIPIFITIAGSHSGDEQTQIARRAIFVAGGILLIFNLTGDLLLRYLGISLEAFQIAGGFLLFKIAFDMVFAHRERETPEEEQEAELREDISIFPLAIPLIAGPGTLASIIILTSEAVSYDFSFLTVLAIASVVLLITYILLCLSRYLSQVLGKTGINVVTRIFGILLSALAVQYVADGTQQIIRNF